MWIYVQEFCMVYWCGRLVDSLRRWLCHSFCGYAFNQSEGGVPEFIDFWNMIVRMGAILEAISFRILAGMLSGPLALFGFNSLSNFSMPLTVIWIGGICGDRFWLGSWGRLVRFSLVNTDWNWFERISALDLLSV